LSVLLLGLVSHWYRQNSAQMKCGSSLKRSRLNTNGVTPIVRRRCKTELKNRSGYFLPPKPLKRALKRSTRPAVSKMRCLPVRSEEHTSELQSRFDLVCRLLLEKKT